MGEHGQHGDERPIDTRPYLSIPYWSAPVSGGGDWDTGQRRPLPGGVVSWLCDSIHPGPYRPGERLEVTIDVRNSGGGSAAAVATVVVYWAVPSAGFAKPTFFAATSVTVPPVRTVPASVTTATLSALIPATAPDHICLIVSVSHAQDRAGTVCDPVRDRHWAQRNLQAVAVAPGAPVLVPFMAANPFDAETTFVLWVRPVDERQAVAAAAAYGMEPGFIRPRIRLLDEHGSAVSRDGEEARFAVGLGPREERPFQALIEVDTDIPRGQGAAIEVGLYAEEDRIGLVGSLGVILLPPEE